MRIEEVIGMNLRRVRERRGENQAEFGEWIGQGLGTAWKPQTVSAAEKGRRAYGAGDLVALAHVLDVPVSDLLEPPGDVETVTAGTVEIPASALTRIPEVRGGNVDALLLDGALRGVGSGRHWIAAAAADIRKALDRIDHATGWQAARLRGVQAALHGRSLTEEEAQAFQAEELRQAEAEAKASGGQVSDEFRAGLAEALARQTAHDGEQDGEG